MLTDSPSIAGGLNVRAVLNKFHHISFSFALLTLDLFLVAYMPQICWALIGLCHITLSVAFHLRVISNQSHDVSFLTCQTKLLRKHQQANGITMWVYHANMFAFCVQVNKKLQVQRNTKPSR